MQKLPAEFCQIAKPFTQHLLVHSRQIQPSSVLPAFPADRLRLSGHNVPGHQIFQFRIFFFHIVPSNSIAQHKEPPALAPGRFGKQRSLSGYRRSSGVVLDHFQIRTGRPGQISRGGCRSGVLHSAGSAAEQTVQSTAGQQAVPDKIHQLFVYLSKIIQPVHSF